MRSQAKGLESGVKYEFRVLAQNKIGMSKHSAASEPIRTNMAAKMVDRTTTSITLEWEPEAREAPLHEPAAAHVRA